MSSQRRFAPIGGRFEPESVAGLAGIYIPLLRLSMDCAFTVPPGVISAIFILPPSSA